MLEKKITPAILRSVRDDMRFGSCAVEIKVCPGYTLGRAALKEHQRRNLTIAREQALYWKIGDDSIGLKPFDGFILKKSEAYLVVYFGGAKEAWAISAEKIPMGAILYEWCQKYGIKVNL